MGVLLNGCSDEGERGGILGYGMTWKRGPQSVPVNLGCGGPGPASHRSRSRIPGAGNLCVFKLRLSRGNGYLGAQGRLTEELSEELEVSDPPDLCFSVSLLVLSTWRLPPSLTQAAEPRRLGTACCGVAGAVLLGSPEPFGEAGSSSSFPAARGTPTRDLASEVVARWPSIAGSV